MELMKNSQRAYTGALFLFWSTVDPSAAPTFSDFTDFSDFSDSKWHMAHGRVSSHSGQFVVETSRGPLDTIFLSGFGQLCLLGFTSQSDE